MLTVLTREQRLWVFEQRVADVLRTLTPREEHVIKMRFGFEDGHTYSLREVATHYGVTHNHIKELQARAMRKLRHPRRNRLLRNLRRWVNSD